jgi:hypothetical protein
MSRYREKLQEKKKQSALVSDVFFYIIIFKFLIQNTQVFILIKSQKRKRKTIKSSTKKYQFQLFQFFILKSQSMIFN